MSALAWILARTPLAIAAALARLVSWLWWFVVPVRRSLAERNFRAAFPDRAPGPALRRMASGLVLGYFELLREERRPGTVSLVLEGAEPVAERSRRGEGTLVLAGHFGSWDLLAAMITRQVGIPAAGVTKLPHSRSATALLERVRKAFGLDLIKAEKGTIRLVLKLLAEGYAIVFSIDQKFAEGVAVPFFDRPALTATVLAAVAARTRVPVYFVEHWREGTGRHAARMSGPLPTTGRIEDDTALFTRCVEDAVRRRPHNWFWLHDRWKAAPPGRARADA